MALFKWKYLLKNQSFLLKEKLNIYGKPNLDKELLELENNIITEIKRICVCLVYGEKKLKLSIFYLWKELK